MRSSTRLALWALTGFSVLGCGGDPAPVDATTTNDDAFVVRDAPGLDAAMSGGTRTEVGAGGGTARSADGLFEIIVPAGTLTEDVEIVITPVAAADVPTDIAASAPLGRVYSVEPDGLAFGGAGAIVHYHFDDTPSALVRDGRFGLAFPVARERDGTTHEWQRDPNTEHTADGVEVYARLAHLSYQWATLRDARGDDYFLGVVFDDSHTQSVGDYWNPHIDFQSTRDLGYVDIGRFVRPESPIDVESDGARGSRSWDALVAGDLPDVGDREGHLGPFAADRPHVARTTPRFFCASLGEGGLGVEAEFDVGAASGPACETRDDCALGLGCVRRMCLPYPYTLFVADPELTRCVARDGVRVSVLDTTAAVREDAVITTDAPPAAQVRVETRGEGTRTETLGGSSYWVTLEPADAPAPEGPASITATNNGATMTAMRDPVTGEYPSLIDDPAVWDGDVSTRVQFGAGTPVDVMPVSALGVTFGPVMGLDTSLTAEADTRLAIRFPGTRRCGPEDVVDMVVFRSILDSLPLDGVLREALGLLATHCEQTIEALTTQPFEVEVSRARELAFEMPGMTGTVEVGRAVTLSGANLLATCGGSQPTFCWDRCVDTTTDPMHCGGCGDASPEVCDGVDNDCDFVIDERCPTGVVVPSSPRSFSDTYGVADGGNSVGANCPTFQVLVGFCGNVDTTTGSIRSLRGRCASLSLDTIRTSTPYTFQILTSTPPACAATGGGSSGGTPFSHTCGAGEVVDTISGMAGSDIGQFAFRCTRLDVVDMGGLWHIVRGPSAMSSVFGTGAGTAFSWTVEFDSTTGFPGALFGYDITFSVPGTVHSLRASGAAPFLRVP